MCDSLCVRSLCVCEICCVCVKPCTRPGLSPVLEPVLATPRSSGAHPEGVLQGSGPPGCCSEGPLFCQATSTSCRLSSSVSCGTWASQPAWGSRSLCPSCRTSLPCSPSTSTASMSTGPGGQEGQEGSAGAGPWTVAGGVGGGVLPSPALTACPLATDSTTSRSAACPPSGASSAGRSGTFCGSAWTPAPTTLTRWGQCRPVVHVAYLHFSDQQGPREPSDAWCGPLCAHSCSLGLCSSPSSSSCCPPRPCTTSCSPW